MVSSNRSTFLLRIGLILLGFSSLTLLLYLGLMGVFLAPWFKPSSALLSNSFLLLGVHLVLNLLGHLCCAPHGDSRLGLALLIDVVALSKHLAPDTGPFIILALAYGASLLYLGFLMKLLGDDASPGLRKRVSRTTRLFVAALLSVPAMFVCLLILQGPYGSLSTIFGPALFCSLLATLLYLSIIGSVRAKLKQASRSSREDLGAEL